jgi:hypothetical protein
VALDARKYSVRGLVGFIPLPRGSEEEMDGEDWGGGWLDGAIERW